MPLTEGSDVCRGDRTGAPHNFQFRLLLLNKAFRPLARNDVFVASDNERRAEVVVLIDVFEGAICCNT